RVKPGAATRCACDGRRAETVRSDFTMNEQIDWTFEQASAPGGWLVRLPDAVQERTGSPFPLYFHSSLWRALGAAPATACDAIIAAAEVVDDEEYGFPNETDFTATVRGRALSLCYWLETDARRQHGMVYAPQDGEGDKVMMLAHAAETLRR